MASFSRVETSADDARTAAVPLIAMDISLLMMVQRSIQRIQMLFVVPPSPNGALIQRLPDLPVTYGCDRALRAMEVHAGRFPPQAKKFDQPPALTFEIADERFVIHLDHSAGQQRHPVSSQ